MSSSGDQPRPLFTVVDCLGYLGLMLGALIGGVVGGWWFGVVGAVVGVPAGAVIGAALAVMGVVAVVVTVVAVMAVRALVVGGPKGFREFLRHGPESLREVDPPAPGPDQTGG